MERQLSLLLLYLPLTLTWAGWPFIERVLGVVGEDKRDGTDTWVVRVFGLLVFEVALVCSVDVVTVYSGLYS